MLSYCSYMLCRPPAAATLSFAGLGSPNKSIQGGGGSGHGESYEPELGTQQKVTLALWMYK